MAGRGKRATAGQLTCGNQLEAAAGAGELVEDELDDPESDDDDLLSPDFDEEDEEEGEEEEEDVEDDERLSVR